MSDAGIPLIKGRSLVYLSIGYEFTVKKSPLLPLATWYWSNTIKSFLDGTADFAFLIILE